MRIYEKIEINRPPSVVWPFVEEPLLVGLKRLVETGEARAPRQRG